MKSAVLITSAFAIISSLSLVDTLSKNSTVIIGSEKESSLNSTLISEAPASSLLENMETNDLSSAFKVSMNITPEVSPDGTLIVDNTEQKFVTMEDKDLTINQFANQENNERAHTEFDIETQKSTSQEETITTAVYFTQIAGWSRENPKAEATTYNAGRANGPLNIISRTADNSGRNTQVATRHPSQEGK